MYLELRWMDGYVRIAWISIKQGSPGQSVVSGSLSKSIATDPLYKVHCIIGYVSQKFANCKSRLLCYHHPVNCISANHFGASKPIKPFREGFKKVWDSSEVQDQKANQPTTRQLTMGVHMMPKIWNASHPSKCDILQGENAILQYCHYFSMKNISDGKQSVVVFWFSDPFSATSHMGIRKYR